uniref:cytochrome oxidase subunit III n=1 Tax=Ayyaria chaetophora TaxID=1291247 RepID=UPI0030E02195
MSPFHLVTPSPWPILASFQMFNITYSSMKLFNNLPLMSFSMSVNTILIFSIAGLWWRDIIRESTFENKHSKEVMKGMKLGMVLFITSEVFFFLSFFWAFFHASLSPDILIGQMWPCKGIQPFNPLSIPLMNTLILISSGISLTVSHHFLTLGEKKCKPFLLITLLLGVYFSLLQLIEYKEAPFTIADSIYGATFFMATGFHGIHVIIGSIFLTICFLRMNKMHLSSYHHFGFEAAAWYWHFVDVVWIFLYICIYWFGK